MKQKVRLSIAIVAILLLCFPFLKDKTTSILQSISTQEENSIQAATTSTQTTTKVIVIDAGHGGYDSGSVGADGILEKDITLAIAKQVGTLLENAGYQIVYTRTSDTVSWSSNNKEDLQTRVQIAELANAAYYISIHTNASEDFDDGAYGFETYIDGSNAIITNMAQQIHENLATLNYSYDRGIKSTDDGSLYVIDKNSVPAMLVEVGFITDSEEAAYMNSSLGQQTIAQAIANGILTSL